MSVRTHSQAIRRLALYGPFGWGNLGDAAIQEAMLHHARARLPGLDVFAVSLDPDDTRRIHGIAALPIERHWRPRKAGADAAGAAGQGSAGPQEGGVWERAKRSLRAHALTAGAVRVAVVVLERPRAVVAELAFLRRSVRALEGVDLFVISGGGQLADFWGGPWYHPWGLLKFAACARLAGARVRVVSVGAGPIRHPLSATFLRWVLRLAEARSYRDTESRELLAPWGFPTRDAMVPDLALSHPAGLEPRQAPSERGERPVIGISPMAYCHPVPGPWPTQDPVRYRRYSAVLEQTCLTLMERGHRLVLFTSQIRNDRYALDDLQESLGKSAADAGSGVCDIESTTSLPHLLDQIARTDVVITSRLHGVILSYLLHRPVIALSYDPKIDAVMRRFGQSEFCLDLPTTRAALLDQRLREMLGRLAEQRSRIRAQLAVDRKALQEQFDEMFGTCSGAPSRFEAPSRVEAGRGVEVVR